MDLDPLDLSFLNRSRTDHLLLNDANGNFVGEAPGFGYSGPSTNMGWGDYDNDLALAINLGDVWLYENQIGSTRHWIDVDLEGVVSNAGGNVAPPSDRLRPTPALNSSGDPGIIGP